MINKIYKRIHNKYSKIINFFFFLRYVFIVFFVAISLFFSIPKFFNYEKKDNIINQFLFSYYDLKVKNYSAIEFIIFPFPHLSIKNVNYEIRNIPEWVVFSLREKFLNYSKKIPIAEKIFIDRSDSIYNHCKLTNNKEIIDFLSKNNFKSYQVSKLNFFEQVYLFKNAKKGYFN